MLYRPHVNLKKALEAAELMRNRDEDPEGVARALLILSEENHEQHKLVEALKHYLRSGEGAVEHARLVRAWEQWIAYKEKVDNEKADFGLE